MTEARIALAGNWLRENESGRAESPGTELWVETTAVDFFWTIVGAGSQVDTERIGGVAVFIGGTKGGGDAGTNRVDGSSLTAPERSLGVLDRNSSRVFLGLWELRTKSFSLLLVSAGMKSRI
jgi:hypothetical protein